MRWIVGGCHEGLQAIHPNPQPMIGSYNVRIEVAADVLWPKYSIFERSLDHDQEVLTKPLPGTYRN